MISVFKQKSHTKEETDRVVMLPVSLIRPNPGQPRRYFDEAALDELAASIRQYGVIQPVTVRKTDSGYELIAGERRCRASLRAGLETVPAIIADADITKSAEMSLLENLQREDLSFFEIAEGYQNLIREYSMTQDELAGKMGKSQSTIANKLRLLKLPPSVRRLIHEFALTERHARALLHITDEDKQIEAVKIICEKRLNVQQTEELVKLMLAGKPKKTGVRVHPIKDVRVFTNTVKKALDIMKKSGVDADMKKNEFDWGTEYVIRVKNSRESAAANAVREM